MQSTCTINAIENGQAFEKLKSTIQNPLGLISFYALFLHFNSARWVETYTQSTKYLGIHLNSMLSWQDHVNKKNVEFETLIPQFVLANWIQELARLKTY